MKTKNRILIFITFLLSVMNMNAQTVLKDTAYNTPNGELNVRIEKVENEYFLFIQETTKHLPPLWESDGTPYAPFDLASPKFSDHLYDVFLPSILSSYPLIKGAIKSGRMSSICFMMRFDDRKESINKGFLVYGITKELPIINEMVEEIVSNDRLITLIKKGAEEIYNSFTPTKREELPEDAKAVLAKGRYDFWEGIYIVVKKHKLR